jgi:hypothetical protein
MFFFLQISLTATLAERMAPGDITVSAQNQSVVQDYNAATAATAITITLTNATLTGTINTANIAAGAVLSLDNASSWTVTGTSYLSALSDKAAVSGNTVMNIIGNGNMVYYDAENPANGYLAGNTFRLQKGGYLSPRTASVVEKQTFFPATWELQQNYPNPFNPATTFAFSLQEESTVSLRIYDIAGKEVATIVNGSFPSGTYTYNWNAGSLASGTYIYRLTAVSKTGSSKPLFVDTKKFVLLK